MNSKIDRLHLKKVGLTKFDIQLLSLLMKTAGEYAMPETPEGIANVKATAAKNLVQIIQRPGEHQRVRLTDEGRIVLAQLEAMAVQPKVEVDNRNG
jgi:hypothetical protein